MMKGVMEKRRSGRFSLLDGDNPGSFAFPSLETTSLVFARQTALSIFHAVGFALGALFH